MKLINIFKQALKEYKLSEDNVTNGWYVTSNGKLISQIFDTEEEAKKHMDDVAEKNPDLTLAVKKLEKDLGKHRIPEKPQDGWYVTSSGKLISQIFNTEEEAKAHMDDVLETDPDLTLAVKKLEKDH